MPTVVIFKKVAVQNMCLRARTLETRPPFLSVPRFASKTARKKTRNVPARSSSSHSTPTSAKSFVIALPLILRSPPCFTREKPTVFSRTSTSSLRKKRSRLGNCILSPKKENYKLLPASVKGYASVLTHTLDCCLTQFDQPTGEKDIYSLF